MWVREAESEFYYLLDYFTVYSFLSGSSVIFQGSRNSRSERNTAKGRQALRLPADHSWIRKCFPYATSGSFLILGSMSNFLFPWSISLLSLSRSFANTRTRSLGPQRCDSDHQMVLSLTMNTYLKLWNSFSCYFFPFNYCQHLNSLKRMMV